MTATSELGQLVQGHVWEDMTLIISKQQVASRQILQFLDHISTTRSSCNYCIWAMPFQHTLTAHLIIKSFIVDNDQFSFLIYTAFHKGELIIVYNEIGRAHV